MKFFLTMPVVYFILICFSTTFAQEAEPKDIDAKIHLEHTNRVLSISGEAVNNTPQEYQLRYELLVITENKNKSNSSKNKQAGSFLLPSSGTRTLSRTSISQNPGNQAIIKLQIMREKKVVATDSITFDF